MPYQPRVVDAELTNMLASAGAVVVEGPKACGKTETARQAAASEVLLDVDEAAQATAAVAPSALLNGPTPRLIDEWQTVPALWNHIRRAIDDRHEDGQFILTGSALPADDVTRHTGAGRFARMRMRPMSLFETGHASGETSMATLLHNGPGTSQESTLTIPHIAERVSVGGWPRHHTRAPIHAMHAVRSYLDEVRRVDVRRLDDAYRDPDRVGRFLQSYARNVGTYASNSAIASDTGGADGAIKDATAAEYHAALDRLMVIEDQPAWAPHLRSRAILRAAPKRHFVDPSLAVAAMRATPERVLADIRWFGFLFESLVVRDLRVYAQANDAVVRQYRDSTKLEVDAIVTAGNGAWAAFEVKLGHTYVDDAAKHLLTFAERVDTRTVGKPTTLAVIVATGYGYVRPDGVAVIPIGALGP